MYDIRQREKNELQSGTNNCVVMMARGKEKTVFGSNKYLLGEIDKFCVGCVRARVLVWV